MFCLKSVREIGRRSFKKVCGSEIARRSRVLAADSEMLKTHQARVYWRSQKGESNRPVPEPTNQLHKSCLGQFPRRRTERHPQGRQALGLLSCWSFSVGCPRRLLHVLLICAMASTSTSRSVVGDAAPVPKGVVRPLADSISVAEAERASIKVREAVDGQQQQRSDLIRFSDANKSLSELVLQLSDSVSHRIMVPFGTAAFFPGRLIHTNEFLVLLGENHYAERSAKQTAEILKRRSQFLKRQIDNVDSQIADLEAESSFVSSAAEEAKAGFVEIREYMDSEEPRDSPLTALSGSSSRASSALERRSASTSDDEHERLMARFSELELAEATAGDQDEESDKEAISSVGAESDIDQRLISGEEHESHGESSVESDDDIDEDEEEGDNGNDEDEEVDAIGGNVDAAKQEYLQRQWTKGSSTRPLSRFALEKNSDDRDASLQHSHIQRRSTMAQGAPTWQGNERVEEGEEDEEVGGSVISATRRSRDYHATASGQSKAFTGQVTERISEQFPIKDQQAEEGPSIRPVSKFKLRQAQANSR